jgi:hypothetical protein
MLILLFSRPPATVDDPGVFFYSSAAHLIAHTLPPTPHLFVRHDTDRFFDTFPIQHRFLPPLEVGKLADVPCCRPALQGVISGAIPHHEREVRERALVADEPGPAREDAVQDSDCAFDLVPVAGLSGRGLLGVTSVEPA